MTVRHTEEHSEDLPSVFVHIVTHNHEKTIATCLDALFFMDGYVNNKNLFIEVRDNNSSDQTASEISRFASRGISIQLERENLGFSTANNLGIEKALKRKIPYVLLLNPDARLESNALATLVEKLECDTSCGVVCPKLLRADEQLNPISPRVIDSSGMYITPAIRHLDRGSQEIDRGQYEQEEYVFGATGAAMLLKREFALDAALSHQPLELFDNSFFAYREDADLAWRSQRLGWKCRYVPSAVGYHLRHVLPENRESLAPQLNRWSVRNRFLLQLNNFSIFANLRHLPQAMFRNILVIGACTAREHTSLPGLWQALKLAPSAISKRLRLRRKLRASSTNVGKWFNERAYSEPVLIEKPAENKLRSVHAVVVNFNSGQQLEQCLESLLSCVDDLSDEVSLRVTVVDNASSDDSAVRAFKRFQDQNSLAFSLLDRNTGFAGAINFATKDRTDDAVLILNPDVNVNSEGLASLVQQLDNFTQLAIVAPRLLGTDTEPQLGFNARSFPSISATLAELFFLHRLIPGNPWTASYLLRSDSLVEQFLQRSEIEGSKPSYPQNEPLVIEQPAAACILVRGTVFRQLSGFDESFWPAWFEDVDFCKRVREAGYLAAIDGAATAVHEGGSTLQVISPGEFYRAWYSNMKRYFAKHGSPFEKRALAILLPLALTLRSGVHLLKHYFGSGETKESSLQSARTLFQLATANEHR